MCNLHAQDNDNQGGGATTSCGGSNNKRTISLLPTHFKPHHYDLVIEPNFDTFRFEGQVSITISRRDPVEHVMNDSSITMHCDDIEIEQSSICLRAKTAKTEKTGEQQKTAAEEDKNSASIQVVSVQYDKVEQTVKFSFDSDRFNQSNLAENDMFVLQMRYTGILNDKMCGFYRSQYRDSVTGEKRWMATTQFEAADARRAFPCFDEPALKSTFAVTLIVPEHMDAISCMPIVETAEHLLPDKKMAIKKRVVYDTTPVMSTYLLAFVIGEFDYIEQVSKHDKRVRVYTQRGKTHLGQFALHVAVGSLDFFTDLFQFDYPISKMDLLAIPDFAAGAMENMGCVTYRETRLLIDSVQSSQAVKQATARTIAHEISHMWFGNLVTPTWWKYLWVKEGFARMLEFLAVDSMFPDWGMWTQFVQEVFSAAQNLDSLKSSHPVEVEVYNTGEISEIFDTISYAKGASLNRMTSNWIGMDHLRLGLQNYIKRHAYGNTTTEDLWQSLEEVSQLPVKQVMDTFVKQTGYPVIIVKEKETASADVDSEGKPVVDLELELTQTRFLIDGTTDDTLWMIPIRITTGRSNILEEELEDKVGHHPLVLMKHKHMKCVLKHVDAKNDWVKLNSNQAGFYRVHYSDTMLQRLAKAVRDGKVIDAADRLGLVNDVFALAKAGYGHLVHCFDLLQYYVNEQEYSVWSSIADNLSSIETIFQDDATSKLLNKYIIALFKPLFSRFGWTAKSDEGHLDALFRSTVISRLLESDDPEMTAEAKRLFDRALTGEAMITPDIRTSVYKSVVRNGAKKEFEQMMNLYESSDSQEEKVRALVAICATKDPTLIEQVISYIWSDKVRRQDTYAPLRALALNTQAEKSSWNYVKENWKSIYEYFGPGHSMLGTILSSAAISFNSEDQATMVEQFFHCAQESNQVNGIERAYQQSVERIRYKAKLILREKDNLTSWLSKNYSQE